MTRANQRPTRVDGCVTGSWIERAGPYLYKYVSFTCDALVFDNRWIELHNPTIFVGYHSASEGTFSEQVTGYYRVPVHKFERLTYDLCTAR